ncbi:MAG: hypothetical protein MPJ22_10870, partial [Pirellulales bacterium]|nr:hypothetical protein [Pirellulales bacterium]
TTTSTLGYMATLSGLTPSGTTDGTLTEGLEGTPLLSDPGNLLSYLGNLFKDPGETIVLLAIIAITLRMVGVRFALYRKVVLVRKNRRKKR